jgi:hypothetical protein
VLHPDNFIANEPEIAAIVAADLASLAEMTTGSIELATPFEVACLEGYEDR